MVGSDAELIAQSLADSDAFGEVFLRHHDSVFQFVARRLGRDLAPDTTAEVFIKAFEIRERFDPGRASALPWLLGISVNVVGDQLRRKSRRERQHIAFAGLVQPSDLGENDIVGRLDAESARSALNDALGMLKSADREVILLSALEQRSYQEIGEALGIPTGTVRSRLARARAQLREHLSQVRPSIRDD